MEVSSRSPLRVDEVMLSAAIQRMNLEMADPEKECNENVRKMISSLQFVS